MRRAPISIAIRLTVLAGSALVLAACGGGEPERPGVATLRTAAPAVAASTAPEADADGRQALIDYAQCMREEGVEYPDPRFDGEGRLLIAQSAAELLALDLESPAYTAARDTCTERMGGLAQMIDPEQQAQLRDSLVGFASCMRDNGVEIPDPRMGPDGMPVLFGEGGMADGIDLRDPDFLAGLVACRAELSEIPVPGLGGEGA